MSVKNNEKKNKQKKHIKSLSRFTKFVVWSEFAEKNISKDT